MEKGEKVALLAIGVNLVLFGIKFVFAEISGSIAVKADAFHSLSDVVASSTVFAGLLIARRKTRSFPYGLYKVENLVSVLVALAILYAGFGIAGEALRANSHKLEHIWITMASVLCVIAITFGYSRYAARVGKEINSPSLVADARHIGVDMFSSMVVLAGLLSSLTGFVLDKACALVVVVIIVWCGGKILVDGIRVLLDASLDYKTMGIAEKLILAEPQVKKVKDLTGRNSGRYKFMEATITLKTHDLEKAHFVADRIETNLKKQITNVDRVLIHYEPSQKENLLYALPLTAHESQEISPHFGEAPCFGLFTVRIKDGKVLTRKDLANPFTDIPQGKGILVAEFLIKQGIDVILTRASFENKGPFYVFSNAAVDTCQTREETVKKALAEMGVIDGN